MKLRYFATTLALISSGAAAQSETLTEVQRLDGETQVRRAGALLADNLKDPVSALFRDVRLRKTIGRDGTEYISVCGQVNSKNSYGGMSGFHWFTLAADSVYVGGPGQIINADQICTNGLGIMDTRDYAPELRTSFKERLGI